MTGATSLKGSNNGRDVRIALRGDADEIALVEKQMGALLICCGAELAKLPEDGTFYLRGLVDLAEQALAQTAMAQREGKPS